MTPLASKAHFHHCTLNMMQNIFSEILKLFIFSILEETVYGSSLLWKLMYTSSSNFSCASNPFIERPHRGWWTGTSCRMCCSKKGVVMSWGWFKSCKLVGRLTSEHCYQMLDSILWRRNQDNIFELWWSIWWSIIYTYVFIDIRWF